MKAFSISVLKIAETGIKPPQKSSFFLIKGKILPKTKTNLIEVQSKAHEKV